MLVDNTLVRITDYEIDAGERGSSYGCPVALALRKAVALYWSVEVPEHRAGYARSEGPDSDEADCSLELHDSISRRVIDYDETGVMEPFDARIVCQDGDWFLVEVETQDVQHVGR